MRLEAAVSGGSGRARDDPVTLVVCSAWRLRRGATAGRRTSPRGPRRPYLGGMLILAPVVRVFRFLLGFSFSTALTVVSNFTAIPDNVSPDLTT